MTWIRQFVSGFIVVWIIMIVVGLLLLGAQRSTLHRAPEMIRKEQAWKSASEEADQAAADIERRAAIEAKVPPNMGEGEELEH